MRTFRIALGLCALLLAWMFLLPQTALGPVERRVARIEPAQATASTPASSEARAAPSEAELTLGPVRTVGPVAVETVGPLHRLPPVVSGAAEPPVAAIPAAESEPEIAAAGETTQAPVEEAALAPEPAKPEVPGTRRLPFPIALDSGTIRSGETMIHIAGVAPIAPDARCADGPRSWPCGVRARTEFRAWLRGRTLVCDPVAEQAPDAPVACRLGEEDVGEWLVRNGWANAESGSRYEATADAARKESRGIWQFEIAQQ
ncbi:thermonuclease family protein [Aureimonas sp. AU40]|uniref:thermonuclease family protein n=1 Tax=Aureimonas sp. AU40 TaxID=1637747 RepID=UPI00078082DA|nr:thermonuclease family protein [Aureimonas sp. AU40]